MKFTQKIGYKHRSVWNAANGAKVKRQTEMDEAHIEMALDSMAKGSAAFLDCMMFSMLFTM